MAPRQIGALGKKSKKKRAGAERKCVCVGHNSKEEVGARRVEEELLEAEKSSREKMELEGDRWNGHRVGTNRAAFEGETTKLN